MNRFHIFGTLLLGAALALPVTSHAQTKEDALATTIEIEPIETAHIVVRNVASNIVVYWLDPMRQPMPFPIQASLKNSGNLFAMGIELQPQPGNGNGPNGLRLPPGIQNLVSIDPQNILWIKGTKKAVESLQKLVEELDVPLNQVGIEAQIWEMSPATLKSLPLIFRDATQSVAGKENIQTNNGKNAGNADLFSRIAFALPTSDTASVNQILMASLKEQNARLLASPRLHVIDGLVGTTQTNEVRSLVFGENTSVNQQDKSKTKAAAPPIDKTALPEGFAFVNGQTSLTARPILRGDAMSLIFSITLDNNITQAATTLRDGQTLAVRLPDVNAANGWPRVALITAKIIPRANDKVAKASQPFVEWETGPSPTF